MTLTREETIERLKQNKAAAEYYAGQSRITAEIENALKDSEAFDMAIEALSADRPTHERDLISRHEALMELNGACEMWEDDAIVADIIHKLPSIEIVRCKDCRHRVHDIERNFYYCELYYGQGDVSDENYCQWGERREP